MDNNQKSKYEVEPIRGPSIFFGKGKYNRIKWFEREGIRDGEDLGEEQIEYIKGKSLNLFAPFYIILRNHWDIWGSLLVSRILSKALGEGKLSFGWGIFNLFFYGAIVWFSIKHARRLSWNRVNWESFDKFKQSENKWKPWGIVFAVLAGLFVLLGLIIGFV